MNDRINKLVEELEEELAKNGLPAFYVIGDPSDHSMVFGFREGANDASDVSKMMEWIALDAEDSKRLEVQEASLNLKAAMFSTISRIIKKYPQSFLDLGEHCGLIKREIRLPKSFTEQKGN